MTADRIDAVCPDCRICYHLRAEMIGRKMRCTNPQCRSIFPVAPADDLPAPVFDWRQAPPPPIHEVTPATEPTRPGPVAAVVSAPPEVRTARAGWRAIVAVLAVASVAVIAGGTWLLIRFAVRSEAQMRAEADTAYADGRYREAGRLYGLLRERLGPGPAGDELDLLVRLSEVRWLAGTVPPEPRAALDRVPPLLELLKSRPELQHRLVDVAAALGQILEGQTAGGFEADDDAAGLALAEAALADGRETFALLRTVAPELSDDAGAKLDQLARKIEQRRQSLDVRRKAVALLDAGEWAEARDLIRRHKLSGPDLDAARQRAEAKLRVGCQYVVERRPPGRFVPQGPGGIVPGEPATDVTESVPALADGVLYSLDARSGKTIWAVRVGGDSPPVERGPTWFVFTARPYGLLALDRTTGSANWFRPLAARPIGTPVVVGRFAAAALDTEAGDVVVSRIETGEQIGRFRVGRPIAAITAGHGHRLIAAGRAEALAVMTLDPPGCERAWSNGHAAGTCRALASQGERLIVLQIDGTDTVARAWNFGSAEPVLTGEVRLPGWSWDAPELDADRLAVVTDAGAIGLFAGPNLVPVVDPVRAAGPLPTSRSALARAEEHRLWVTTRDRLHGWRLALDRAVGRRLVPTWSAEVGSPSAPARTSDDGKLLTVVGVPYSRPVPTATTVQTSDGRVVWQRPLGFAPVDELIAGDSSVTATDLSGRVWELPVEAADGPGLRPAGRELLGPTDPGSPAPRSARFGNSLLSLGASGRTLTIRRARPPGPETKVAMPADVFGRPTVAGRFALLPLANGLLARVRLDHPNPRAELGPSWRSPGTSEPRPCLLDRGGDEFWIGDGRKWAKLFWPADGPYQLDADRGLEMPGASVIVVGPAVLLATERSVRRIDPAEMAVTELWSFDEPITAGPFAVADRWFAVAAGARLSLHELGRDSSVWSIDLESPLTAPPVVDGRLLVLPTRSGLTAVERETGRPLPVELDLPPGVGASAAPAAVAGVWVVPLTDGTVTKVKPPRE